MLNTSSECWVSNRIKINGIAKRIYFVLFILYLLSLLYIHIAVRLNSILWYVSSLSLQIVGARLKLVVSQFTLNK